MMLNHDQILDLVWHLQTDVPYSNSQEEPDHLMTGMDEVGYITKIAQEGRN
jgi:hypothetical protein